MRLGAQREKKENKPNLYVYSLGLLFFRRARKILTAHGYNVRFGVPFKTTDMVAVWGRKRTYKRGKFIANRRNVPLVTIEDSFIRSLETGRQGAPSIGVIFDKSGIFFDTSQESDLQKLIKASAGLPSAMLEDVKDSLAVLQDKHLSKYNAFEIESRDLPSDFVLVVDQTKGDASIRLGGADKETFNQMLKAAIAENPNVTILIKSHPETSAGKRLGHFSDSDTNDHIRIYDKNISPWVLFSKARSVYCVTSQLGLEAIFAGHRPVVFGVPFYARWGLTDDRNESQSQQGWRTAEQLFWAVYQKYTLYYDPFFKRKSNFHAAANTIFAQAQNWRDGSKGAVLYGIRLWKRGFFRRFLSGAQKPVWFVKSMDQAITTARQNKAPIYRWGLKEGNALYSAAKKAGVDVINVEDGFIRSKGLGAKLIEPVSLIFDKRGIYYDPTQESGLEYLINRSPKLNAHQINRSKTVIESYVQSGLSKYNLDTELPRIANSTNQKVILVVGQVEDDASVLLGTTNVSSNHALLWAVRQRFPNAYIIYKPHPDVVAGLRVGVVASETLRATTDLVIKSGSISKLISKSDVVCTMTSLAGFEALLQGREVICYGAPFYAGWGLTTDLGTTPQRRIAKPSIEQLVHATLIDYPRYWDPVTGEACPVEVIIERFRNGQFGKKRGYGNRSLSKLQGLFASYAHLWR